MSASNLETRFNTSLERLMQWQEIDRSLNESSEGQYGIGIDAGVNDLAVGLNAILGGYFTRMSCEGHADKSTSPWVTFSLTSGNLEIEQMRLRGLIGLLDEFYEDRDVEDQLRVGIYPISGASQGAYALTTGIGQEVFCDEVAPEETPQEATELLEAQQGEVSAFGAFIREKFLGGFVIDTPVEL